MRHVADRCGQTLEELYQIVGWPLYKKYGHAYDAFKLCLSGETEDVFEACPGMDTETKACLTDYVKKKLKTRIIPFVEFKVDFGEKNRQKIDQLLKDDSLR